MADVDRRNPIKSGTPCKLPINSSKTADSTLGEAKRGTQAPSSSIKEKRERAEDSPDPPKTKRTKVHELKIQDNGKIVEVLSEETEKEENELEDYGGLNDDFWGEEDSEPDWDGQSGYDDEEEAGYEDDEEAEFII